MKHPYLFLALSSLALTACSGGGGSEELGFESLNWEIPVASVVDGGPGKDGIPSIDMPIYVEAASGDVEPDDLVVGIVDANGARALPHDILDYHEVVNDQIDGAPAVLSYCPLTGSALLWMTEPSGNREFGVSGLLYLSNLILYDRDTDSHWSQMIGRVVEGPRRNEVAAAAQIVETTWATWQSMYPDTFVLSRDTGHLRNYDAYPYADFRTSTDIFFGAPRDSRMHEKTRILGVRNNGAERAYPIPDFGENISLIEESLGGENIVAVGSEALNFAVAYSRELPDSTSLTFTPLQNNLPGVMMDNEGTIWDVFGVGIAGPRTGEQLPRTDSYIAYWFAWAAFHPDTEISGL
ncbi:MAG: DUF3179 domain-containing protein, partial [Pseudomonadota bacterium]